MAKTMKLLLGVGFMLSIVFGVHVEQVEAQNVFHVWFDTVTARAGDTAVVNVHYTLHSTHAHNLDHFQLRLQYDSSEVSPLDSTAYDLDSTASEMFFDTTTSFRGIIAQGSSEIDTTNPVLMRIRFRINRELADTAFIQWDTLFNLFDPSEGMDEVIQQNGWIRTSTAAGHVIISTPPITAHGITAGFSPDSVAFLLPVSVSNISAANMRSALLSFAYDSARFPLNGVFADAASGIRIDSVASSPIVSGSRRVNIWMHGVSGAITGSDTLLRVGFMGLVGLDTVCDTLGDVSLRPTNSDGLVGNTVYLGNPICLEGEAPNSVTLPEQSELSRITIYPNPARDEVRIEAPNGGAHARIVIYDMLGRTIGNWNSAAAEWEIPASVAPGIYRVVCNQEQKTFMKTLVIER